jgi:replicative DNA helicase
MARVTPDFLEKVYSKSRIIKTFSSGLNKNLGGGLHPGMLFTIEGAPDGTKSTFAQQILEKAAEEFHYPAMFIISELTPLNLYLKSISKISRKNANQIESKVWENEDEKSATIKTSISDANDMYVRYADCLFVDDYSERPLTIDGIEKSVTELREQIKRERNVLEDPPFSLFIESIQRIKHLTVEGESHDLHVDRLVHDLKELARKLDISIVALYDLPAFPMLYEDKSRYYSSQLRNKLGDTAYASDVTAYIEMGDWLMDVAIKDFSMKGVDAFTQKLEEAKRHFPLSNPKLKDFAPTYSRMLFTHKKAGVTEELFFIYLQATNEFLEITL